MLCIFTFSHPISNRLRTGSKSEYTYLTYFIFNILLYLKIMRTSPPPPKKKLLTKYFYFHSLCTNHRFLTEKFNISGRSHWIILIRTCSHTLIPRTHNITWCATCHMRGNGIYYEIRETMNISYW